MKPLTNLIAGLLLLAACGKKDSTTPPVVRPVNYTGITINNISFDNTLHGIGNQPVIRISFSEPLSPATVPGAVHLTDANGAAVSLVTSLQQKDSLLLVQTATPLKFLTAYSFSVATTLQSASGGGLTGEIDRNFITLLDSTDKFPRISDDSLLSLVQRQTFKYFWDFGHPVSGMARERNASADVVTTGGSGFGIMALPAAINRGFISRADGLGRLQKITTFLKNIVPHFHGAFSHWMNGVTGAVVPFAANDDGADLVETSYMMMGLLTARQYFNGADPAETALRGTIDSLWKAVEWDWFRQNGKNVLYWNWSPNSGWAVNVPVQGWNETLITYVLAASSPTHPVPKAVYDSGFSRNGAEVNGATYYGYTLPLGQALGGPLFFEHYSFLGINPNGLTDAYANYQDQTLHHSLINFEYCKANPHGYYGYGASCWGLTASDIPGGYTASSPTNDVGVIAPTAALSSMPYTPAQSLDALRFFYYKLGDRLWADYGFYDSFNLNNPWFSGTTLAIDQGPEVVMIENYRSGLLWNLFMSCPEIKTGMTGLGFSSPHL